MQPFLPEDLFYYGMDVPQMFPFSQTRATHMHRLRERPLEPYEGEGWPAAAAQDRAPAAGGTNKAVAETLQQERRSASRVGTASRATVLHADGGAAEARLAGWRRHSASSGTRRS